MRTLSITATVHRWATGAAFVASTIAAVVTVVDPAAFGIPVEYKAAFVAAVTNLGLAINVLRARTDPQGPQPPVPFE